MIHEKLTFQNQTHIVSIQHIEEDTYRVHIEDGEEKVRLISIDPHRAVVHYKGNKYIAYVASTEKAIHVHIAGEVFTFHRQSAVAGGYHSGVEEVSHIQNAVEAPMPGKLLKLFVKEGQKVKRDERLFIVEAMKMENEVRAPRDGIIHKIHFKENDLVSIGEAIVEFADWEVDQTTKK